MRLLGPSEGDASVSGQSRAGIVFFSLLPCLVASLLFAGCIAPIPMTKRVSGPVGVANQKKIDLTFVQPGRTSREEVSQKLAWADSGIKDDHLFLARWASSGSGWVWFFGGVGSNGAVAGDGGSFRVWTVHNFLVEFDDGGLVKSARDVQTPELLTTLQQWVAHWDSPADEPPGPVELKVSRPHLGSPVTAANLVLSADSFGFQDYRKPKHNFQIPLSTINSITSGLDDKAGHAPDSSVIGVTILFKKKTPAGKQVSFNISPPDLLVLLKYLHVASSSPHAL
jgi:hypothetical protein